MKRQPLGLNPELRTPPLSATHVRAGTGHRVLARNYTTDNVGPPTCEFTRYVRPRVATTLSSSLSPRITYYEATVENPLSGVRAQQTEATVRVDPGYVCWSGRAPSGQETLRLFLTIGDHLSSLSSESARETPGFSRGEV